MDELDGYFAIYTKGGLKNARNIPTEWRAKNTKLVMTFAGCQLLWTTLKFTVTFRNYKIMSGKLTLRSSSCYILGAATFETLRNLSPPLLKPACLHAG